MADLFTLKSDIRKLSRAVEGMKAASLKDYNAIVDSTTRRTRKLAQRRVVQAIDRPTSWSKSSVYFKIKKAKPDVPHLGLVRVNQVKWTLALKWVLDGGIRKSYEDIRLGDKGPAAVAIPAEGARDKRNVERGRLRIFSVRNPKRGGTSGWGEWERRFRYRVSSGTPSRWRTIVEDERQAGAGTDIINTRVVGGLAPKAEYRRRLPFDQWLSKQGRNIMRKETARSLGRRYKAGR